MDRLNKLLRQKSYVTLKWFIHLIFLVTTGMFFIYLNRLHPYYFIDEAFHVPQTLRYCNGMFFEWDPKITTLPGLYLITAAVLAPFGLCSLMYIRCINLIGTFLNFYLISEIIEMIYKTNQMNRTKDIWLRLTMAYIVTLFPPLFFWFFLYYTDVVSVNMILSMLLLHHRGHFKTSALVGLLAIFLRQTNVIWVALLAMERTLDLIEDKRRALFSRRTINTAMHIRLLWNSIMSEMRQGPRSFVKFIVQTCISLSPHITVGLSFVIFLIWNNGIVVGDRNAHVPTIHIPQIFYFSVFAFCFAWPYMLPYWKEYLQCVQKHWILASLAYGSMTMIVSRNTLVHPYVLADNRHYIFYVWNKLMNRFTLLRYLLVPIYGFTMYSFSRCISHLRFASQMGYIGSTCLVLIPQLLLEPRYFIIPYILFRLNVQRPKTWQILMEFLTTFIVNYLQFFIFINKVFYWQDRQYPQRISW